jgi:hypothetical protein
VLLEKCARRFAIYISRASDHYGVFKRHTIAACSTRKTYSLVNSKDKLRMALMVPRRSGMIPRLAANDSVLPSSRRTAKSTKTGISDQLDPQPDFGKNSSRDLVRTLKAL